ncbi:MAG: preprotein translocase subunit SecG [Gammaproteobacteria bacterium]|nr:preprotein translocase subunit SecG [Gammaproteobacteria bacterium]
MTNIHTLLLILQVLVGVALIALILVQRGKGAEMGAAFGAGASGTVFGAKGSANFLSRSTAVLATVFFATSLGLAYLGAERPVVKSVVGQVPETAVVAPMPGSESQAASDTVVPPGDVEVPEGATTP